MLKIRLQRVGRTNVPVFRVVLTESTNGTKSGRYLEVLGSYDPRDDKQKLVKIDRVKYWISKGAQLSDTLHNHLVGKKEIAGKKVNKLPKKTPIKKDAPVEAPAEGKKSESTPVAPAPQEEVVA